MARKTKGISNQDGRRATKKRRGRPAGSVDARQVEAAAKKYEQAKSHLADVTRRYVSQVQTRLTAAIG